MYRKFEEIFSCFGINFSILQNEKFLSKNANHTISIYGSCMTSIFLVATTKIFPCNFKIAPKKFSCVFFNRKPNFVLKPIFFKKKICMQSLIFCVHNVVRYTLLLVFFPFCLITFFLIILFLLYGEFMNALINF